MTTNEMKVKAILVSSEITKLINDFNDECNVNVSDAELITVDSNIIGGNPKVVAVNLKISCR